MQQLAHRFDLDCEITVLPNGVLAVNSGTGRSSLVTASRETLRFDQTERLFAVLRAGGTGRISAEAGLRELRRIVQRPPPVRAPWRFGGYCLMAVGLCLRQNPGLGEFIAALALSIPVAALLIAMPRLGGLKALIPAVMAFAVGASVAVLSSTTSWSNPRKWCCHCWQWSFRERCWLSAPLTFCGGRCRRGGPLGGWCAPTPSTGIGVGCFTGGFRSDHTN